MPTSRVVLLTALAFLAGSIVPINATILVRLSSALSSTLLAVFFTTLASTLLLLPLSWYDTPRHASDPPKWLYAAGIFSAISLASAPIVTPITGMSLYFVSIVSGQILSSTLLDHFGILVTKQPLSLQRIFAIVVVLTGVALEQDWSNLTIRRIGTSLGVVFIGICIPLASVMNKRLSEHIGSPIRASNISVFVASCTLLLAYLCNGAHWSGIGPSSWWHWCAGITLTVYWSSCNIIPKYIGVAPFFVMILCGKLLVSLVLDTFGLLGLSVLPATTTRVCGVLCACVGGILMQAGRPEPRSPETRALLPQ